MHLLKKQRTQDGVQFLGRSAEIRGENRGKLIDRQFS
jgi:hypothetical protein